MAEVIEITEQDRIDAENILEEYLTDAVPDADFSKGSSLRDLCVVAIAYVFAYWKKERDYMKARQSLLLLGALTGQDVDDAVDEILSNWFITRNSGSKSTGTATVYLSTNASVTIPPSTVFYKTQTLQFVPNSSTTLAYLPSQMLPIVDASGEITSYTIQVPLIASDEGAAYDIDAGSFNDVDRFSPNIVRVVNTSPFSGGDDDETTDDLLVRAETAITVRDLNGERCIDTQLRESFSTVEDVAVVGYGDPEMLRDLVAELATNTRIHAGGYVDAYLRTPITYAKEYTGVVGAAFSENREGYYILRDPTVLASGGFETAGVERGDIIEIYNALSDAEANRYIVEQANEYGVYVSSRTSFPLALPTIDETVNDGTIGPGNNAYTDSVASATYTFTSDDVDRYVSIANSATPAFNDTWRIYAVSSGEARLVKADGLTNPVFTDETGLEVNVIDRVVEYSIGDDPPSYSNKVSRRFSGQFTKTIQNDGRILLPFEPIYRITDVSFSDPSNPYSEDGDRVYFPVRSNQEPVWVDPNPVPDYAALQYQVVCQNVPEAFSGWQVMEVDIGWPDGGGTYESKDYFNGKSLRVTYDALTGYDSVWAYMLSGDQRILCGSVIPKGLHPVYIQVNFNYRLANSATDGLDTAAAATSVANFVNNFDTQEDLDTSDLVTHLRTTYGVIGYVEPPEVLYQLFAPDGRVITYKTTDRIIVDANKVIDPATEEAPLPAQTWLTLPDPLALGVSNATLRYLTVSSLITFTELSNG